LMAMAGAVALANLLSYCGALVAWRTWAAKVRIKWADASKQCAWQIGTYSGSLLIWMVGTLLVSGLDLTIVGIFDYRATAYYAIAATLTGLVTQVQGAIFATLLPATAVLGARGDSLRLGQLLVSSTRYGMLILLAMALPLILGGHLAIRWWAGADYAEH